MDDLVKIGAVAKRFGLSHRTLRFYEDKGLLNPKRVLSQIHRQRLYQPEDLERVELIVKLKAAGFTLQEIQKVVMVKDRGRRTKKMVLVGRKVRQRLSAQQILLTNQARTLEKLLIENQ